MAGISGSLGSGTSPGTVAVIGVVPLAEWDQYAGFPNTSDTNLVDSTGSATTMDLVTALMSGNSTTRASGSGDLFNMFTRGVDIDSSPGSTIDFSQIPYSTYDVYIYFCEDTTSVAAQTFSVTDGTTTYYYENQGADNFNSGTLAAVTSTSVGSPDTTGNYVKFTGLTAAAVTITCISSTNSAVDVVGFQVVEDAGGAIEVTPDSALTTSLSSDPSISITANVSLSPISSKTTSLSSDPSIQLASVVLVPAQSPKSTSNSSDPSVSLTSTVEVPAQSPVTTASAQDPSIQLASGVAVSAQAPSTESNSIDPIVSLTAVVNVSAQSTKTDSTASDPVIILSVPLVVQAQSPKTTSAANDPTIGLAGAVNVVALFGHTVSSAPRPTILVGTATRIDDFTINYRESDVSGSYQSGIETSYSSNILTANYRG